MNVPKGNAIALQQLRPVENKTADILSGYVFELIKQKKADDAARLKALADKGAAVDEVVSKMDLKIDATLPQFQEASNQYGKSFFDKKYEAERLRGDYSPEAQAKKERLVLEANKIKSDYELAKGFYANPEINAKIKEAQKAIAENKLYKGGKSYSSFLAVMGAPSVAGEENGNFGLYHYEQGADKPIKENKTVFTPVGDLYNNILALEEDTSPKTWTELEKLNATITNRTDSGIVSRETVKLKEQAVRKSIRDMLGVDNTKPLDEQFESVSELPKETKHIYYDLYKKEPQSKEDFVGFEDKILNRIKAKTNESDRLDVNLPSSSGGSGGSKNSEDTQLFTPNNTVLKIAGQDGLTRYYKQPSLTYYTTYGYDKNQQRVGITVFWNPNGKNANGGKGAVNYGVTKTSNDGKETVTVPVKDLSAVYNYLDSNSVEQKTKMRNMIIDAANVVSQQMKVAGDQIKDVNQLKNYKVDFEDVMKRGANANKKPSSPLKSQSALPSAN